MCIAHTHTQYTVLPSDNLKYTASYRYMQIFVNKIVSEIRLYGEYCFWNSKTTYKGLVRIINEHRYVYTYIYIYRYTRNANGVRGSSPAGHLWGETRRRNANSFIADCRITRARIHAEFGMHALLNSVLGANLTLSTSRVSYPPSYLDITVGGSTDPPPCFLQPGL